MVGGVEGNAHPLTAGGGHGEGVGAATANHIQGDGHTWNGMTWV